MENVKLSKGLMLLLYISSLVINIAIFELLLKNLIGTERMLIAFCLSATLVSFLIFGVSNYINLKRHGFKNPAFFAFFRSSPNIGIFFTTFIIAWLVDKIYLHNASWVYDWNKTATTLIILSYLAVSQIVKKIKLNRIH